MLIQKEWRILDEQAPSAPLLERILASRGLNREPERSSFLNPSLADLQDPFLLPDMDRACASIADAIASDRLIVVHGDYDVDGLTATALLVRFFRRNGIRCEALIPDRLSDGYGLSESSVARARALGASLLVTVDCGVTSLGIVAELMDSGIDVVITDHHECLAELPPAHAVVNPKRPDSAYPTTSLSGVGVTFKLIEALCATLHLDGLESSELSLVALGTVADVVPLLGENRILVREGLEALNHHRHLGLTALLSVCLQQDRTVDATTIGYALAPRLNAAGRLGEAMPALELLMTDDPLRAAALADQLQEQNRQRQALEAAMLAEAIEWIDTHFDFSSTDLIILARPGWHTGVVGIVCSRLVDLYHRPVIVFGGDGDRLKGSARTCGHFNLLEAVRAAASFTTQFGGHRKAAGIELERPAFEDFKAAVNRYASENAKPLDFRPEMIADALVSPDDLTENNAIALSALAPFGEGNRQPLLVCRNLRLTDWRLVGNGKHVRLAVQGPGDRPIVGIAFNLSLADDLFAAGDRVDLLFALERSEYLGRQSVQLQVRDIHPAIDPEGLADRVDRALQSAGQILASWTAYTPDSLADRIGTDPASLIPDQPAYVAIYQYLRATYAGKPVQTDLSLLARRISRSYRQPLNSYQLARALEVFAESGLVRLQPLGQDRLRLELLPAEPGAKVRLSDAPTYQLLKRRGDMDVQY
jgi:single-stranded-DNA-specific exonuclease